MRKFCNILFIICVFIFNINPIQVSNALSEKTVYGKVLNNCYLYKNKELISGGYNDIYFQIPETYFVVVLETLDDNILKVQYDRFVGYIDSSTIEIATFIPIVKNLEGVTCDLKTTSGTQIWSAPTTSSDMLTTISAGSKNINYIASIPGAIPSGGESNVWYYISFTPSENSTNVYEGYIYSENVASVSEILANTETNPEVINTTENEDNVVVHVSSTIKTIMVVIIAVPIILFIVLALYKFIKIINKNTNKKIFVNNYKNEKYENLIEEKKVDIEKFKHNPLCKIKKGKSKSYPQFPQYDAEDDLL